MKIVAYYRVSTKRQGLSGLGLEGQKAAVDAYAKQMGAKVIAEYTEVESGKRSNRPQLEEAIGHANIAGARLVVAKLDRLSRNVAFLSRLMESGVDFIACDNPHAEKFTVHILVAVAEKEAEDISNRTIAGLASYKRRGGILGASRPECRNLTDEARRRGARAAGVAVKQDANKHYQFLYPKVAAWRAEGRTYQEIADTLNSAEIPTRRGSVWTATTVQRVERRALVA